MRFPSASYRRSMLQQLGTAACTRSYVVTFGTLDTLDRHPQFNLFLVLGYPVRSWDAIFEKRHHFAQFRHRTK
jgi:hypothetical protein